MSKDIELFPAVQNELEVMQLKLRIFGGGKDKKVWEALTKEEKEIYSEPLHMAVRMVGGAGSVLAGKPGERPEGFTWKVRRISQKLPERPKRVEKWTGLRLRKDKKRRREKEIYGKPGEEDEDEGKDELRKRRCTKPKEWKKSRTILALKGFFGKRKPGDYERMSVLKDPTTFKYMEDLEKAGLAEGLKKKQEKVARVKRSDDVLHPEEGQVKGREMVGMDGQIWPYGGMGAPWYEGPLCHPECTCLIPGWEDPSTMSRAYKLLKKLHDATCSPQELLDSYLDTMRVPSSVAGGPPYGGAGAPPPPAGFINPMFASRAQCWQEELEACADSRLKQLDVLREIGEEIYKMMQPSSMSLLIKARSSKETSPGSEEAALTLDKRDDCVCREKTKPKKTEAKKKCDTCGRRKR